ncbi:MAG: UDP-glucose 4-epimerase GalE [Christensenellaceae bacterium]|jgi:UDP-glucose 4-epimerase
MILVTGGAGYIGSHTCVALAEAGYEILILDNFINSKPETVDKIRTLIKKDLYMEQCDLCDKEKVAAVFDKYDIEAVVHFAGLKAVGESVEKPLRYYSNNLVGILNLLEVMQLSNVKTFIFSSSATVYSVENELPVKENGTLGCTNPYGYTKLMTEQILQDVAHADSDWHISLLRYFNPIGAHKSGLIGDNPSGIPNNLMPYISRVATGQLPYLQVFGDDYDTPDGTGVRDYLHVQDLAAGHVAALRYMKHNAGVEVFNLGTGQGVSVLELIHTFEQATGEQVPYKIVQRRLGDVAALYADASKAKSMLNWKTVHTLEEMCADTYHFEKMQKE